MGNSASMLDMDRLSEIVSETMGLFAKNFTAAYADAVLENVKEESMLVCRKGWALASAPPPAHALKKGFLTKQGHNVKSWKRRYFTALNAADNYALIYYVDETETEEKGRIDCFGCRVEPFTEEEAKSHGQSYGLKLVPYIESKRVWFMYADNEQEMLEWQAVLATACRKAGPKMHENPVVVRAFNLSLQRTRIAYQLYGVPEVVGDEIETLSNFVIQILIRELLDDTFASIKNATKRASSMEAIRNIVEGVVSDAAKLSWSKCLSSALKVDEELRSGLFANLPIVLDTEQRLITHFRSEFGPVIFPVMSDLDSGLITPFLNVVVGPIVAAHISAVNGFHASMKSWIRINTSKSSSEHWNWPANANTVVQYGVKQALIRTQSLSPLSRSTSFANTAYSRNRSTSSADAMPYNPGFPLTRSASMPVDVNGSGHPVSPSLKRGVSVIQPSAPIGSATSGAVASGTSPTAPETAVGPPIPVFPSSPLAPAALDSGETEDQNRIITELFKCHMDIDSNTTGPLLDSVGVLWNLYTVDLAAFNEGVLSESLNAFDVYTYVIDSLQVLLHNAVYTLEKQILDSESDADITPELLLKSVDTIANDLVIDAKKSLLEGLVALCHDLILCTIQEMVLLPCIETAAEEDNRIPSPLVQLLNVKYFGSAALKAEVDSILSETSLEALGGRLEDIKLSSPI